MQRADLRVACVAGMVGVFATLLLVPPAAVAQTQSDSGPIVEPSRQVTADPRPDRLHVSPDVAVDPRDPDTVVIGTGDARNGGCGLHVSRDGGVTFAPAAETFMPPELPYCVQLNFGPMLDLAFAPDGDLYVATAGSS